MNRMISRRYLTGEVYAPHDMSAIEQENWRVRKNPDRDVFDALNLNPLDEYKVCCLSNARNLLKLIGTELLDDVGIYDAYG